MENTLNYDAQAEHRDHRLVVFVFANDHKGIIVYAYSELRHSPYEMI